MNILLCLRTRHTILDRSDLVGNLHDELVSTKNAGDSCDLSERTDLSNNGRRNLRSDRADGGVGGFGAAVDTLGDSTHFALDQRAEHADALHNPAISAESVSKLDRYEGAGLTCVAIGGVISDVTVRRAAEADLVA